MFDEDEVYQATTEDIRVEAAPFFLEDQSNPAAQQYVWGYRIRIENLSRKSVQLRRRYWRITDAMGRVQEVRGDGVIGEQPKLAPGEFYEYSSGAPLETPSGIMSGHYEMEAADGQLLIIDIPAFSLDSPYDSTARH